MKHIVITIALIFWAQLGVAEAMDQQQLHKVIAEYGSDVKVNNNVVEFTYEGVLLICISDSNADRMRIISPIANVNDISVEMLMFAMAANFHTALDARYAVGDAVLYSAFIHPLSTLNAEQVHSAIYQVANTNLTFGTEYSSGAMSFPGGSQRQKTDGTPL